MEQKKGCELCGRPARMYCESDQASLCWVCDERVHSANFLVAKHTRRLLCQVCQSPTPWAAAGPKLGTTVSVCEGCFDSHGKESDVGRVEESHRDVDDGEYSMNEDGSDDGEEEEDDEDELEDEESMEGDEYDEDEEEEDGENQVVPWSCDSPPPPAASSSSSGEESAAVAGGGGVVLRPKRVWDIAFGNDSDDDIGCASSQEIPRASAAIEEEPSSASFRPLKHPRFGEENPSLQSGGELRGVESKSTSAAAAIIDSLKRLQKNAVSEDSSAATVLGICRLSRC